MGFVKTPDEIARIEVPLSKPRFVSAQMLLVDFFRDSAWVAIVLPAPLAPAALPRVTAMVGRWQSNCVGEYNVGGLYIAARYGDLEGEYVLSMWMSTDRAIIYGRDLFGGEPNKCGVAQVHRHGDRISGRCMRDGVSLLQMEVDLEAHHGPASLSGRNFTFKARLAATGLGLEDDALLTLADFDNELTVDFEGCGAVKLTGTAHDPLAQIEVREVVRGSYIEGDLVARCRVAARTPAQEFLPFHYGHHDDWSALDTEHESLLDAVDAQSGPSAARAGEMRLARD